jgi:predicted Rdx family selenoprotein
MHTKCINITVNDTQIWNLKADGTITNVLSKELTPVFGNFKISGVA